MVIRLGIVAGEILTVLEKTKRPIDLEEIETLIEYPNDTILMAFGWLIREGHIHVHPNNDKLFICCSSDDQVHCPGGKMITHS